MRHFSVLLVFCLLGMFLFSQSTHAQQFQWVRGGGTSESSATLDNHPEGVNYMCTDNHGNVYALSQMGNSAIIADTFYRFGAYGVDQNMFLSSYDCQGHMRWAKLIGSNAGESWPFGIVADSMGHVYIAGYMTNGTLYIGYDTSISGLVYDDIGVIQFDTNGHFNWVRYVGNNTLSTYLYSGTTVGSLTIDNANNIHFVPYIKSGVALMPGDTSRWGNYDLKYNTSGTLLSARRLQLDSSVVVYGSTIDRTTNTLYTYGYRSPAFTDSSAYNFIAAFDTFGNRKWIDTIGDPAAPGGSFFSSITPDNYGHLYVCGESFQNMTYNGDSFSVSAPSASYLTFIMKTDTSGNKQWLWKADAGGGGAFGAITLLPGNKVAAVGAFQEWLISGLDTIINSTPGSDPFISIIDTAGVLVSLVGVHGDGYQDGGVAIANDATGNLYIGGSVADSIPDTIIPAYYSVGGNTDFFVLKYGVPCGCTSVPSASFTTSGTVHVTYTYTGTVTGLDSVVWQYGDGSTGIGSTSTHGYATSGTYHVCAIAYTNCGIDSSCSDIHVTGLGVNDPVMSNISVFPNPATDELNVTGIADMTSYRLLDVTGSSTATGTLQPGTNSISVKRVAPGIYIMELTGPDGGKRNFRVVKE